MKTTNFGEHLMLDCYGAQKDLLDSKDLVWEVLNELPQKLSMKKLGEPIVYHADDNSMKDPGGWSGFVVIAESHISIHTFVERRFLSMDVYTCRNGLDCDFVKSYIKEKFKVETFEENFVKRGTKYPNYNID